MSLEPELVSFGLESAGFEGSDGQEQAAKNRTALATRDHPIKPEETIWKGG